MDDLVAFLRARLDEDEAVARAGAHKVIVGEISQGGISHPLYGVARHDPARVLRDVEAKRKILDNVVPQIDAMDRQIESEWGSGGAQMTGESDLLLMLLALPYSDHPDYRPGWRP